MVLHVEDVRSYRRSLQWALRRECDIGTIESADYFHAIEELKRYPQIRVVVADEDLGHGPRGMAVLNKVKELWPDKGRVLLSGLMTADLLELAYEAGHQPFGKDEDWPSIVEGICQLAKR